MSTLENRLNLRRQQCQERRRYLAELGSLAQRLRADERRLQADIERAVAVGNAVFAGPLLDRHSKLARSVAVIDAQIAEAGEALAATERELKRQEFAWVQRADGARLPEGRRAPGSPQMQPTSPAIAGPDHGS